MKRILILILAIGFNNVLAQKKEINANDSLLKLYTIKELKEMTFEERVNIRREINGQEPIDWPEKKTHDRYGIKIIWDIQKDKTKESIHQIYSKIELEKEQYRKEVFPNSHVDVMNEYFGDFYKDIVERSLRSDDYPTFHYEGTEIPGKVDLFSNFTKRTYHFNAHNEIKLITIEVANNINGGEEMDETKMSPIFFVSRSYYIQDDTLKFVHEIFAEQRLDKYYYTITQEDLDSTKVKAYANRMYFYKDNRFMNLRKESSNFSPKNWYAELESLESEEFRLDKGTRHVILFRNYMKEYQEYINKDNDYLHPTRSSFIQPYIVEPE